MCSDVSFQYNDIVLESEVKDFYEICSICPLCRLVNRIFVDVDPNPELEFPSYEYDHVICQLCSSCWCLVSFKIHI